MSKDRNYEYEKNKAKNEIQQWHRGLLRYTAQSIESLNKYQKQENQENQEEFKSKLNGLVKFYWSKFDETEEVEKPEKIMNEDLGGPADMTKLSLNECQKIFYRIQKLQEELGHTKLESLKRGNRVI